MYPGLEVGFERGVTKKTSFERHNRGREDNIKWEFEKQVVNALLELNCIRKCKVQWLPFLKYSGNTSGVVNRSVPIDC
jgi:hypothetical protein